MTYLSRRQFIGATASLYFGSSGSHAAAQPGSTRVVPADGQPIPAIGMGTWITFNVGDNSALRDNRCTVLQKFFELGGRMVDSSPMYGSAEQVLGYCSRKIETPKGYLPTTKVWTSSEQEGRQQIASSFQLWNTDSFGLYQVHNLVNWQQHLPYLQELKQQGKVRYVGISTSHGRRHQELEQIMATEGIDFVQLTYNLQDRVAENRLFPLAMERGIAVVVNRPFRRGGLFDRIGSAPLPGWAKDIDCKHHAQIMLKFIISHPAVSCAIPATSKVAHMEQNMAAMHGPLPDRALRQTMLNWFEQL